MLTALVVLFWLTLLVGVPAYFAYHEKSPQPSHICSHCKTVAVPLRCMPGSVGITLVLLLLGIVPGVIYMIWRSSAAYAVCPTCHARNPIPLTAPRSRGFAARIKDTFWELYEKAACGRLFCCPKVDMAYDYEIRGFSELATKMEAAAREVGERRTKRMVLAGARVFKREMVSRAPVLDKKTANSTSLEPGALKKNIRIAMLKKETIPTAIVGPGTKTDYVARFVEYGHRMVSGGQSHVLPGGKTRGPGTASEIDVPAHPFIRPAFESAQGEAEQAMIKDFDQPIEGLT
jgi:HK97 gp10 family phage protein